MRNCLVMGCGRSGTSMVAGCLHGAGAFVGDQLLPPTPGNPKGYFESRTIEAINEELLYRFFPPQSRGVLKHLQKNRLGPAHRWLARFALDDAARMTSTPALDVRMSAIASTQEPFAFKDPRFCFTLPAWRSHLGDAAFVTVFRRPDHTVASILKECATEVYLNGLPVDEAWAFDVWRLSYEHILTHHASQGDWLFLHYDQVLSGDGIERLSTFLGSDLPADFTDRTLRRSTETRTCPSAVQSVYEELCRRADHTENDS